MPYTQVVEKKVNYMVYLEKKQLRILKELSRVTKVPVAVIIREGVDLAIEEWTKEWFTYW